MTATLIDGTAIAKEIRSEVAKGVAEMKTRHGVVPGLAVVLAGDDPASAVYVRNKERAAGEVEMLAEVTKLPADTTQDELLRALKRLNSDDRIHGIIVQLPLPAHIDEPTVIEAIDQLKDVDGLHPANIGRLVGGRPATSRPMFAGCSPSTSLR